MYGRVTSIDNGLLDEFRRLQTEMDELFGTWRGPADIRSAARGSYPPINIGSLPDQVDVYLFAAGLDPDALDISIQQNVLTIAGERKTRKEEDGEYYLRERYDGAFRRAITLPENIDSDQAEASYRDGVLRITLPKRVAAKPRNIQIK